MKVVMLFIIICLAVFVISCSSSMKVQTDYDPTVNIAAIKTYHWLEKPREAPDNAQEALTQNTLLDKRVKKAVNIQLIALGFQMEKDNPDVLVTYYIGLQDKVAVQRTGGGFHGRRGRFSGGTVYVDEYKEGTLIVDVLDAASKEIIWRGIAVTKLDDDLKPKEVEKKLSKAVKKMFETLGLQRGILS